MKKECVEGESGMFSWVLRLLIYSLVVITFLEGVVG